MRIFSFSNGGSVLLAAGIWLVSVAAVCAQETVKPISVNGDNVEFQQNGSEVVASGNVELIYQDVQMRCDKIQVFMDAKLAIAQGHVYFKKGETQQMRGEMIIYDFEDGTGSVIDPDVVSAPYYGRADIMERLSDTELLLNEAQISTCDLPHPHYCLRSREVKVSPGNKISANDVSFSLLNVPAMYFPHFSQRLTDRRPKMLVMPGYEKDLGFKLMGFYRYYLNENAKGLIHMDWYDKKGLAEGLDLNYNTKIMGQGHAKYYRVDEFQDTGKERMKVEIRHQWDVTNQDRIALDFFKQSDPNFRKDYFYREYEKATNPASYFLYSHAYPNATLSLYAQPKVNDFDAVVERLPELKLETVNQKILGKPYYYKNMTAVSLLSDSPADSKMTEDVFRIDTTNQITRPLRFFDLEISPFVGGRQTYYGRGLDPDQVYWRGQFLTGTDVSTKLYKIYDVSTNLWNLNIERLRHIITPTVSYNYKPDPTVEQGLLQFMDEVDTVDNQHSLLFSLEHKFQTKRDGQSVDLARFLVTSDYNIERNDTLGKGFQNVKYDLELRPYGWWWLDSDGDFDPRGGFVRSINTDYGISIGRSNTSLGYRFKKEESSQLTAGFNCPLNPFWTLYMYERFEFKTGDLVEQEYSLERDMHCWIMKLIVNQRESEGLSFFIGFRLKAFPEIGANMEKTFDSPRSRV